MGILPATSHAHSLPTVDVEHPTLASRAAAPPRHVGRYVALDGLRGLAAFSVVIHHALLTIPAGWTFVYDAGGSVSGTPLLAPLGVLWAGHEAVLLFFVLSGFVLVARYGGVQGGGYVPYLAQRIPRLFVPYAVVVGVSCALLTLWHPSRVPETSHWFALMWSQQPTARMLAELALMRMGPMHNVDTAAWSLAVEMRLSLLLPIVAALGVLLPLWRGVIGAVLLTGVTRYAVTRGWEESNVLDTLSYAPAFLAGAIMAAHRERLAAAVARLPRPAIVVACAAAWFCYTWRWQLAAWWSPRVVRVLTGHYWDAPPPRLSGLLGDLMPVAGSVVFIVLAIGTAPIRRVLERPWTEWLGRISFSLYLVHPIVLLVVVHALAPIVPVPLAAALAVLLALPAAVVTYRYVEVPSHQLARTAGRWVSARVGRRRSAA